VDSIYRLQIRVTKIGCIKKAIFGSISKFLARFPCFGIKEQSKDITSCQRKLGTN
jgi:hypothetical protein